MKTVCVSYVILYTRVNPNFIQTDSNIQTSRRKAKFEQIHTHLHDIKRLFKAKRVSFILHGAFLQHSFTETHSSITACQSSAVKNRQRLVTSLVLSVFVCLFTHSVMRHCERQSRNVWFAEWLSCACAEQNRNTNTVAMATLKGTAPSGNRLTWTVRAGALPNPDAHGHEDVWVCGCVCFWCQVSWSHEMQVNKDNVSYFLYRFFLDLFFFFFLIRILSWYYCVIN